MATLTAIRSQIKTKLEAQNKLAFVYNFHQPNLEGYPAATFDVSENENEFLTNKDNKRVIAFQIVIYQEVIAQNLLQASTILDDAADQVINAFENDFDLGSTVDWCEPLIGSRETQPTPQGAVMTQQLTLRCHFVHTTS